MKWTIDNQGAGLSLGQAIKGQFKDLSLRQIKRDLEKGAATLNGKLERFASKKVAKGDVIAFLPLNIREKTPELEPGMVLFENEDLLVINKPAGLVCKPEAIEAFLSKKVYLVHRLDKETSGALILAKNGKAKDYFEKAFKERQIQKTYLAYVFGSPREESGTIEAKMEKGGYFDGQTIWKTGGNLEAVTRYRTVRKGRKSILELKPLTGRTHQIRVHLSHIGCPIVGDLQYGRKEKNAGKGIRLQLHAFKVAFDLPKTGETVEIMAPLYPDMVKEIGQDFNR